MAPSSWKREVKQESSRPSMASTTSKLMSLKLLIDKEDQRVLFGEVGKDFVDFLFDLFRLPIGTAFAIANSVDGFDETICALGKLKNSFTKLDPCTSQLNQENLLNTGIKEISPTTATLFGLPSSKKDDNLEILYRCESTNPYLRKTCASYVAESQKSICPCCRKPMNKMIHLIVTRNSMVDANSWILKSVYVCESRGTFKGSSCCVMYGAELKNHKCPSCGYLMNVAVDFVHPPPEPDVKKGEKEAFIVMDDLVVKPNNGTVSNIALISSLDVKNLNALEEKVVYLGKEEAKKLLLVASSSPDKVLTTLFLGKKRPFTSVD